MTPSAGGRGAAPLVEVIIGSPHWRRRPRLVTAVKKAIRTAAKYSLNSASNARVELAIVLTDDSQIRALNHEWRKIDSPTNVLSFPATGLRARRRLPRYLGDIVIAYQTTAREAAAEHKPLEHHLVHLAVHGFLHLLGYDHATDRDAGRMERLEIAILARLGIPDPYAAAAQ